MAALPSCALLGVYRLFLAFRPIPGSQGLSAFCWCGVDDVVEFFWWINKMATKDSGEYIHLNSQICTSLQVLWSPFLFVFGVCVCVCWLIPCFFKRETLEVHMEQQQNSDVKPPKWGTTHEPSNILWEVKANHLWTIPSSQSNIWTYAPGLPGLLIFASTTSQVDWRWEMMLNLACGRRFW